jgi:hypothetical protein
VAVKNRSRVPILLGAAAAVTLGAYVVKTTSGTHENQRRVTYSAEWSPEQDTRASLVKFGVQGAEEWSENRRTPFSETRWVNRNEIVTLDIILTFQAGGYTGGCQIQVGTEAPKKAPFRDGQCVVEKYVP